MIEFTQPVPSPTTKNGAETRLFAVCASAWVMALWLLCRPFRGIRHDAILYVGQTFNSMWPGELSSDWFFLGSAQDRYTIFSPLMTKAIQLVGLQSAEIGLLLAFNGLFLAAAWLLLAELPSLLRWAALVSLAALSHTYGGEGAFAFAEPFLTARTLAEPFALLALALLLRRRLGWALLFLLASVACHPLVAVPVMVVGWIHLGLGNRRWWWLALLLPVVPLLGIADVGPFAAALHRFDPAWFDQVRTIDSQCFLTDWGVLDWATVVLDLALLVLGCRLFAGTALARLGLAAIIATVFLTLAWGLGADAFHNILVTQLQLWRIDWVLHFLALCLVPAILFHEVQAGEPGRLLAAAIVLACVSVESNWDTGWVGCLWLAIVLVVVRRGVRLSRGIMRLATWGTLAVSVLIMAFVYAKTHEAVMLSGHFGNIDWLSIVFSLLLVSATAGIGGLLALRSTRRAVRGAMAAVVVATLVFAAGAWDQRSPWQAYTERAYASAGRPFEGLIPAGASVYWDGEPLQTWLLLHRPSYFSINQASGLVFSRAASMEFARRNWPFKELLFQHKLCSQMITMNEAAARRGVVDCRPSVAIMKDVCNVPGGGPDYMIFDWGRPEGLVASWKFEEGAPSSQATYYLYDCSKLR